LKQTNELAFLLNNIQSKTDESLEAIAKTIGRSVEHLIRLKNNPEANIEKTVRLLKEKYAEVLKDRILDNDKFSYYDAAFEVVFAKLSILLSDGDESEAQLENLKLQQLVQNVLLLRRGLTIQKAG
jgi:hypothetical protein